MNIFIDIETLRAPEETRLQMLEGVKSNFKAPSTLTKAQAATDLGLTDAKEIKFTSKDDMISRWEKELAETKAGEVANAAWEKTSFNPDVAPIACICIGWYDDGVYRANEFDLISYGDEQSMLDEFHLQIIEICSKNGAMISKPNFIGHYITKFDLPFIWKRSVINNVSTASDVKWVDAKHGYNCYDTLTAWAGYGNSISMDNLADILGIKGKGDIDGSMVYDEWQKYPQKVIGYCHADVEMVKAIYERLTK